MQKVSVQNLEPGMITYHRLRTADGRVLLGSQIELSTNYLERIKDFGISALFITNPIIERMGLVCEETLPEEKKSQATKILKDSFEKAQNGELINVYSISALAKMIIESIKKNQIIRLDNSVTYNDYFYLHGVNVAALAAVIASDMDYNSTRLHELVMGALLHDIGMAFKDEEMKEIEHPQKGFDYVRKLRGYSIVSGHVVFQHHEKYDGTGYPRRMISDEIHEYARITAIADAYDKMVTDNERQQALLPHQAYEAIMSMSGTYFDKKIADIFLAKAPLYPLGAFVKLDSGHIGVVTEARPKLQSRPTITIITDTNGVFVNDWLNIDMTKNLTTFITHVMNEKETIELTQRYESKQN